MTRFFFHLHNGSDVTDFEGTLLRDLAAAHAHARAMARFEISETVKQAGEIVLSDRIDVADGDGQVLDSVAFRDVVTIRG